MKQNKSGFAAVEAVIILVVIAAIAGAGYFVYKSKNNNSSSSGTQEVQKQNQESEKKSGVKIKHLGVNLDYYDPATNKAGDFVFTKAKFSAGETMQMIFMNYGFVIPGNSTAGGQSKANPQPTFILPMGTKVHSLVDGEVFDVPKLYSDDYSVMVRGEGSELIFETEHIINVKVKKGDKVKAGDVVGEVSGYSAHGYDGLGLVEIGVLKGGNPPSHLCTFDYLDDSIKDETLKKITSMKKAWEEYRGDSSIYDETKVVIPGCESRGPIEG